MFWLTLVVGLGIGWWVAARKTSQNQHQLERQLEFSERDLRALTIQLEGEGYEILDSSIGPFLRKRAPNP